MCAGCEWTTTTRSPPSSTPGGATSIQPCLTSELRLSAGPDVSEEEIAARAKYRGQRRLHSAFRALQPLVDYGPVDVAVEPLRPVHDLLRNFVVDPHVPLPEVEEQLQERHERQPAG